MKFKKNTRFSRIEPVVVQPQKQNNKPIVIIGSIIAISILVLIFFLVFFVIAQSNNKSKQINGVKSESTQSTSVIHSNQWYSSLYKDFPTSPIFALPLVYQFKPEGIGVSYPTINRTPNTIFGSYDEDFLITKAQKLKKPQIEHIRDWSVKLLLRDDYNERLYVTIGRGIPYVTLDSDSSLTLSLPHNGTLTQESSIPNVYILETRSKKYIVFAESPSQKGNTINLNSKHVIIALLPDNGSTTGFERLSHIDFLGSQAHFKIENDKLITTYEFNANKEGLMALYPHHLKYLDQDSEIIGTYETLRGPLSLIKGHTFSTSQPLFVPPVTFEKLSVGQKEITEQIKMDVVETIQQGAPGDSKNYFLGTWFGKVSNLIELANTYGLTQQRDELIKFVEPIYVESLSYYQYDQKKTSLISIKPEFGNEELNDHHFHYGYFVRLGSILGKYDKQFLNQIQNPVELFVSDIATTNRSSQEFPYLRNFDIYEGHSWADGFADTGDGNNQESTSEAMNAWYSLYLWGKVTNNQNLQNYALYLLTTEKNSAFTYWFDQENIYGKPYEHAIASIVWGGKVDFTTWFSADTNKIYGIQLLPITPASVYLGGLKEFPKYKQDFNKSGGKLTDEWGDLFAIFSSFYEGNQVFSKRNSITKLEDRNTKSALLYYLYKNSQ